VIVDVGANIGVYALVAKTASPRARVLAFEPVARHCEYLERNCHLNRLDVHVERVAVSNRDGTGWMRGWLLDVTGAGGPDREQVPVRRLDTALAAAGDSRVDLIKVDVEGHEAEVLEGLGVLLRRDRPTMLLEVLSDAAADRLRPILDGLDYVFFDIDDVSEPRRVETLRKSSHWNVLVCLPAVATALGLLRAE
jgi:FkbM family methyltransferase